MILQDKISIGVFASGTGTNARNIFDTGKIFENSISIACLVTDNPGAPVLEIARLFGIPHVVIPFYRNGFASYKDAKMNHEERIISALSRFSIDWILLAGYMRILSEYFISRFTDEKTGFARIVNIHPSLLPAFPGKNSYQDAFNANVSVSGATIHLVTPEIDSGPIILQHPIQRKPDDSFLDFKNRGMENEYELYGKLLQLLAKSESEIFNIAKNQEISCGTPSV